MKLLLLNLSAATNYGLQFGPVEAPLLLDRKQTECIAYARALYGIHVAGESQFLCLVCAIIGSNVSFATTNPNVLIFHYKPAAGPTVPCSIYVMTGRQLPECVGSIWC